MLLIDGVKYELWTPPTEEEFEQLIKEHAQDIFGKDSIYFDLKKGIITKAGIGSIPDGYVISFQNPPCWYICEVELHTHPLYAHIVPQITKFINSVKSFETQREIINALDREISSDPFKEAQVKKITNSLEIYRFIANLISKPPILVIVIDQKNRELEEVCSGLPVEVKVVEFQTFKRVGAEAVHAHLFEPMFRPIDTYDNQKNSSIKESEHPRFEPANKRGLKLYIKDGRHYNPKEALLALGASLEIMVEGRGDRRATMPDGTILEYVGSTKNGKSKIAKVHAYLLDHGFIFS